MSRERGAIGYNLAIQIQCPHCNDINDISLDPSHIEDQAVVKYVEKDILKDKITELLDCHVSFQEAEDVVEYTCCECGQEAEYTAGEEIIYPPQLGASDNMAIYKDHD